MWKNVKQNKTKTIDDWWWILGLYLEFPALQNDEFISTLNLQFEIVCGTQLEGVLKMKCDITLLSSFKLLNI